MIPGTDLHQFDVHNDGYFAHLLLNYVDGVIFEMAVPRMPYKQLAEFLEEKCGCYFQALLKRGIAMTFLVDEMVDWAEMEVETDSVEARTSTTRGVEARNSTTEGVEARNSTTEGVEARTKTKDKGKEKFWHVIPAGGKLFEVRPGSEGFTLDEGYLRVMSQLGLRQTCILWLTITILNQSLRGPVRDECASGTKGGAIGSRGRGGRGSSGSGGASGSIGRGAGGPSGASGSKGRGVGGSRGRGAGGSKRKHVSAAGTQKRQGKKKVETSGFAKGFGLQDEPEQSQDEPEKTQAEPQQTQHEPEQTQVKDQVEQTEDQAEIDLTQVEQTQEQTQKQVQPQEQPHQAALRMPSARILEKMLGKQGSS
nr:peroxidase 20 [Tanacetum cinerariifolium]